MVRAIFRGYLELGSPLEVADKLNRAGLTTRRWSSTFQHAPGGGPLAPPFIYRILTNPVYRGWITHTPRGSSRAMVAGSEALRRSTEIPTQLYPGLHEPIIDQATWHRVQEKMKRIERQVTTRWTHTHLLKGKLRTFDGDAISPSSVQRNLQRRVQEGRQTAQLSPRWPYDWGASLA